MVQLKESIIATVDATRKPLLILCNYLDFIHALPTKSPNHPNNLNIEFKSCLSLMININGSVALMLSFRNIIAVNAIVINVCKYDRIISSLVWLIAHKTNNSQFTGE